MAANMDGYFSPDQQRIAIRAGMSEVQTVSAAVHEIAHSKLHNLSLIHIYFILSLCELIVGGKDGLQPVQKTIIDRCVRPVSYTHLFLKPVAGRRC